MKISFAFILLLLSVVIFGQVPKNAVSIEDKTFNTYFLNTPVPVVKGKILNLTPDELAKIEITYSLVTPLDQPHFQMKKNCNPKADGSFELTLDYPFPYQQIWLSVGDLYYAGVYANTELYIELDATLLKPDGKNFVGPGITYSGKDGSLNTFLNNHVVFKRTEQSKINNDIRSFRDNSQKLSTAVYLKKLDSLYELLYTIDREFIKQNPSEFSWILKNERLSDYYGAICVDHWVKPMPADLFERVNKHKPYLISNEGMSFYNYLFSYLDHYFLMGMHDLKIKTEQRVKALDSLFAPSKADLLKIKLSTDDARGQVVITQTVLPGMKTEWSKIVLREELRKKAERLQAINTSLDQSKPLVASKLLGKPLGETAFGAKLYVVDSLEAPELVANLKRAFDKKALFIDLWATWCGPCIGEFPASKKLHESTRDLPVEFVYLCTSESSDLVKWKSKIAEYQLGGTHIFVDKRIVNKLLEMFSGNGFPTYVFINAKGAYKPGAIERPSHHKREYLEKLLTE